MTDDLAAIRGRFGPAELQPALAERGVEHTVLVQTIPSLAETEGYLAIAAATGFVAGVVGWVDLTDPGVAETIARLRDRPDGHAPRRASGTRPRTSPIRTGLRAPT